MPNDVSSGDGLDVSSIAGNVSPEIKEQLVRFLHEFSKDRWGDAIFLRTSTTEVSLQGMREDSSRKECRFVCELTVEEDMCNYGESMHGGCTGWLVDYGTSTCIYAYGLATTGHPLLGVSQTIDVSYHSPAILGDRLRIVSSTLSVGKRTVSARAEIWNATAHRLVATGVQIKMDASPTKAQL